MIFDNNDNDIFDDDRDILPIIYCNNDENGKIKLLDIIEKLGVDLTKEHLELSEEVHLKIIKLLKSLIKDRYNNRKVYNDHIIHLKNLYIDNNNEIKETVEERNNYVIFFGNRLYPTEKKYNDAIMRYEEWYEDKPETLYKLKDLHKFYFDNSKREYQDVVIRQRSDEEINKKLDDTLNNIFC